MLVYKYSRKEDSKQIIDTATVTTVTTTYIGRAKRETYSAVGDYAKAIWSIEKRVEDTDTGISIKYRPNRSQKFEFVWNDRATLTYV